MKLQSASVMLFLCLVSVSFASIAQAQQAAPPPVASGTPAMTQAATTAKITNARVVEMAKMGLDDDVSSLGSSIPFVTSSFQIPI